MDGARDNDPDGKQDAKRRTEGINNFDIVTIDKAVSDSDGTAIIYDTLSEHNYSATVNKIVSSGETKIVESKIETITLNSVLHLA